MQVHVFTNGKQRFYLFMGFYVIQLKNQGIKIWSYHFKTVEQFVKSLCFKILFIRYFFLHLDALLDTKPSFSN